MERARKPPIDAKGTAASPAQASGPAAREAKTRPSRSSPQVRVVVVDDHRFMRELISTMLARQSGRYHVVAENGDAETAIKACKDLSPDLLILDINLPDLSGIEAVPHIKRIAPDTRILLCTAFASDERVVDALRSGAHGFVEKTNTWHDFVEAVERVSRGEEYFIAQSSPALGPQPVMTRSARQLSLTFPLSLREKEVLTVIAHGHSNKEIAEKLGLSVATVDTHRANVMRKVQARNVAELIVYAFRTGIVKLPKEGFGMTNEENDE